MGMILDFPILAALIFSVALNLLFFLIAMASQTDKLTDFTYSLSFLLLDAVFFFLAFLGGQVGVIEIMMAIFVAFWALRLGAYLFRRILLMGSDARFDGRRENFWAFLLFWLIQAVAAWAVMTPVLLLFMAEPLLEIPLLTWVGLGLFVLGFVLESLADAQKFVYRSRAENDGHWVDQGLWRYSRHPNYLGEIILWWGLYFAAIPVLQGWDYLSGLGPLYLTLMLLFVTGVPLLEQKAQKAYGDREDFAVYRKSTGLLFPHFPGHAS
ncbi:MAG: DUF1295 domain-containing protein [Spirochaetales bacterium]|nr:DUF1295 domain-containing protein [Spirochaetales bacterium]